jgi:uncharacterized protein (TIGR02145 family)
MKKRLLTAGRLSLTCVLITLFLVSCKKENEDPSEIVKDVEGNSYTTVTIGTQTWLVENLKTTKYNDGTDIPILTADNDWEFTASGAYCWYENNVSNKSVYGALYNWYAANSGKLCPTGWHVPSKEEVATLIASQGGHVVAGGALKEAGLTHWREPNTGATNSSGFTGLPGGNRFVGDGGGVLFQSITAYGNWWTTTPYPQTSINHSYYAQLVFDNTGFDTGSRPKTSGFSVRCLKD